jgi:hypothetical protein
MEGLSDGFDCLEQSVADWSAPKEGVATGELTQAGAPVVVGDPASSSPVNMKNTWQITSPLMPDPGSQNE